MAKIPVISKGLEVMGNHTLGILLYHGSVATVLFSLIATLNHDSWFPPVDMTSRLAIWAATLIIYLVICIYGPKMIETVRYGRSDEHQDV